MQKITLKLTNDKLAAINACFALDIAGDQSSMQFKGFLNIVQILKKRLLKKAIDRAMNDKKFIIRLEYYEAYTLYNVLSVQINLFTDQVYEFNLIHQLISILDKELQQ